MNEGRKIQSKLRLLDINTSKSEMPTYVEWPSPNASSFIYHLIHYINIFDTRAPWLRLYEMTSILPGFRGRMHPTYRLFKRFYCFSADGTLFAHTDWILFCYLHGSMYILLCILAQKAFSISKHGEIFEWAEALIANI